MLGDVVFKALVYVAIEMNGKIRNDPYWPIGVIEYGYNARILPQKDLPG